MRVAWYKVILKYRRHGNRNRRRRGRPRLRETICGASHQSLAGDMPSIFSQFRSSATRTPPRTLMASSFGACDIRMSDSNIVHMRGACVRGTCASPSPSLSARPTLPPPLSSARSHRAALACGLVGWPQRHASLPTLPRLRVRYTR